MEKNKYELADELIAMWETAFREDGNALTIEQYYHQKMKFMVTLGEFEDKIKEECW